MLSAKALIIGVASTATVGGVSYLTWTAIKEEEREEFELNKFNEKWNKAANDEAKMKLLEEELVKLCKENEDGCNSKEKINNLIKSKKPELEDFFKEDKFSKADGVKTGFDATCKSMVREMKIKAYCPD